MDPGRPSRPAPRRMCFAPGPAEAWRGNRSRSRPPTQRQRLRSSKCACAYCSSEQIVRLPASASLECREAMATAGGRTLLLTISKYPDETRLHLHVKIPSCSVEFPAMQALPRLVAAVAVVGLAVSTFAQVDTRGA